MTFMDSKFFESDKFKGSMKVTLIACVPYESQSYSYYDDGERYRSYLATENGEILVWDSKNVFCRQNDCGLSYRENIGESFELKSFTVKARFESKKYGKVTQILRPKYEMNQDQ